MAAGAQPVRCSYYPALLSPVLLCVVRGSGAACCPGTPQEAGPLVKENEPARVCVQVSYISVAGFAEKKERDPACELGCELFCV